MRVNRVHYIFHERAAITTMAIPVVRQEIASVKRAREIVRIETHEPMSEGVHALEKKPSAPTLRTIGLADTVDTSRIVDQRWIEHLIEVRLDHPMITARLKEFGATRKRLGYIGVGLKPGDANSMRVNMTVALYIFVKHSHH